MRYAKYSLPMMIAISAIGLAGPAAYLVKRNAASTMGTVTDHRLCTAPDTGTEVGEQTYKWSGGIANFPSLSLPWSDWHLGSSDFASDNNLFRLQLDLCENDGFAYRPWLRDGIIIGLDLKGLEELEAIIPEAETMSGLERTPGLTAVELPASTYLPQPSPYQEKVLAYVRSCLQVHVHRDPNAVEALNANMP